MACSALWPAGRPPPPPARPAGVPLELLQNVGQIQHAGAGDMPKFQFRTNK